METSFAPGWRRALQLFTLICLSWAAGSSAQGLVSVPDTLTHELNAYYLSRLGHDLEYYSLLVGRNTLNTNVYNQVNGLPDATHPVTAAALTSPVHGSYGSHGISGKVAINIYYKLLRCSDPAACSVFERVIITNSKGPSGPQEILSVLKGGFAGNSWLINANQSSANFILSQPQTVERTYKDATYSKSTLFYKVAPAGPPCSSAKPQTQLGAIGEFEGVPQFACVLYNGAYMLMATDNGNGYKAMVLYGVNPGLCDGSLTLFYVYDTTNRLGPKIAAIVKRPNAVPLTLSMILPLDPQCLFNYGVNDALLAAANLGKEAAVYAGPGPDTNPEVPASVKSQGFRGTCQPAYYFATYGMLINGQVNVIAEQYPDNGTWLGQLVDDNSARLCTSALADDAVSGRNENEDACAQWFSGDLDQQREAVITYNSFNTTGPITADDIESVNATCFGSYNLGVANILPQIAIDFEADRVSLLSSTEVKIHMDAVAANAASVIALEIALASSGIVIARMIARSSFYRRQSLSSSLARLLACLVTTLAITVFNVPNFALIIKSLQNHNAERIFTTVSTRQYKPSNFSAFVLAETHAFVEVRGSSATAIIGLLLYATALLFSLYITWGEFTEIIKRKNEAARCLGHEALIADKDLLIEWRGTDSKLHDILHPSAVKESGLAAEVELMRRAVARKNLEAADTGGDTLIDRAKSGLPSPGRGVGSPRGLGSPRGPYRYQGVEYPAHLHPGTPPSV